MARHGISSTIYVGRPDLIDLSDEVDHESIDIALTTAARTATEITILGGFYNLKSLISLFEAIPAKQRRKCRVRVAVGLEAKAMIPQTWIDMRQLRTTLVHLKFPDPEVRIVDNAPVHFHTKLFRFLHKTYPIWFIGSANPGSRRHELMMRLSGRHDALSAYIAAVFDKGINVEEQPPAGSITTLQDFFLSGVLCHKPHTLHLFTFNGFHFNPADRERLSSALAGSSAVAHADPRAQGFGFDLRSAIGLTDKTAIDGSGSRIQVRSFAFDTVFGWWMPRAYSRHVQSEVQKDEADRARRLATIGRILDSDRGRITACQELKRHVATMRTFLDKHQIRTEPANDLDSRFMKFLASRINMLKDPITLRRYAQSLTLTDMPNIWADGSAVRNFEQSFFDDLAFRTTTRRQSRVVKSVLKWLGVDDVISAEAAQEQMIARFHEKPWNEDCWI